MPEDRAHKLRKGGAPMSLHLLVSIRRVIPFGCVAGYVEVIAFLDPWWDFSRRYDRQYRSTRIDLRPLSLGAAQSNASATTALTFQP